MCTLECRSALWIYSTVERGTFSVRYNKAGYNVFTLGCRKSLCVYSKIGGNTACVLYIIGRHCVCNLQYRETLYDYLTFEKSIEY